MKSLPGLTLLASSLLFLAPVPARAAAPQAYTLKAKGASRDINVSITIQRDGPKERVESVMQSGGRTATFTTIYDFAAHKVYWLGTNGPGSCSSGRYTSARAPIDEDPVTGAPDQAVKVAAGRQRKPAGAATVAGLPARVEQYVGKPAKAVDPDVEPLPTKAWLAQDGGYVLKLEGPGKGGKPVTMIEVTEFSQKKPDAAAFAIPKDCVVTNATMDDSGEMRAHGEAQINAEATATHDLATDTGSATVKVSSTSTTETAPAPAKPAQTGKITEVKLELKQFDSKNNPCGHVLRVAGTVAVDGPATIWYRVTSNVGGFEWPYGQEGTLEIEFAGETSFMKDIVFPASKHGEMRLQAAIVRADGKHGPLQMSKPAPFQVTCK